MLDTQTIDYITQTVVETLKKHQQQVFKIPVGVSARHVHLTQEHIEILFGKGYQLTKKKTLMGGQFAAEEAVTLVGKKLNAIEKVRVLGPARKQSQVELAQTDTFKLGIQAPLRESGDLKNSAPLCVVGPKGSVYLEEGCIVAKRHIHIPPEYAQKAKLKDGDEVAVKINNSRGGMLEHVKVRVDESFTLEMHIDTDEANATQVKTGDIVQLMR